MQYNYDYFISYAHKDNENQEVPGFVEKFEEKLRNSEKHQRLFGEKLRIFFDKSSIQNMSDWNNNIRAGLASSRFLIVLLSPKYFQSEFCAKEFDWWMKHEMHRCTLGEGTAPILIYDVANLLNPNSETIPDIPEELRVRFPNWLRQIRKIQADLEFDMHDLLVSKIDDVLNALRDGVKDKVRHQDISEGMPRGKDYPKYNKKFVGRRDNLLSLRRNFTEETGMSASALTGLGGFGKTELALTYGHAFGWDYQLGRFFKPCENCNSIYEALLTCGILEMYGLKSEGSDEDQLKTLCKHLEAKQKEIINQNIENDILRTEGTHLLLILDNVNNLDLISQLNELELPDYFHVIITTRENTSSYEEIFTESVECLSEDETVELLNNLRLFDDPKEAEAARKIAQLLAGFTLVVELTGKYLYQNRRNPLVTYQSQYERLYNNHAETFQKMADKIGDLTRHAAETVAAVMESTLSAISPKARKALAYASLMAPDAVALSWLPELCDLNEDEGIEILNELIGYSLLTPLESEPDIARIHRLVADTVKKEIPEKTQNVFIAEIRDKCNSLLKNDKTFWCTPKNSWNIKPVSEFCLTLIEHWTVESSEDEIDWGIVEMLANSGDKLCSLGRMNEARDVFQRYFGINEERAKAFPSNFEVQRHLGVSYERLGDLERASGNIALARKMYITAMEISQSIFALRNVSVSCLKLGDLEKTYGNTAAAREWHQKAMTIIKLQAEAMPDDTDSQRDLSISYSYYGDSERAAGNAVSAREWYRKTLEISKRLAEKMSDDVGVQRDLSISYERLGELEKELGNFDEARELYKNALEIQKTLASKMPDEVNAQRDMSITYERLGDIEKAVENTSKARLLYTKALEIAQRLAAMLPDDIATQHDLSISYSHLGDFESSAGNVEDARKWYTKDLDLCQWIADKFPDNADLQRGLSIAYERLGDIEKADGNVAAARDMYKKALNIAQLLVDMGSDSVRFQRGYSVSCINLGDLEISVGNFDDARVYFEKALNIFMQIAKVIPNNVQNQRELGLMFDRLGDLEKALKNINAARVQYKKASEVLQRLVDVMPENVLFQQTLGNTYNKLGDLELSDRNAKAACEYYMKVLEIVQQLNDKMPENAETQNAIGIVRQKLFLATVILSRSFN